MLDCLSTPSSSFALLSLRCKNVCRRWSGCPYRLNNRSLSNYWLQALLVHVCVSLALFGCWSHQEGSSAYCHFRSRFNQWDIPNLFWGYKTSDIAASCYQRRWTCSNQTCHHHFLISYSCSCPCLKAIWLHSYTVTPPPQIWEFRVTCGVKMMP